METEKKPKTEMDQRFIDAVHKLMEELSIDSERAMSIQLGRHPDFINRVKHGIQSAPAEAWDLILHHGSQVLLIEVKDSTNTSKKGVSLAKGNAIGTNHGIATMNYGTVADCEKDLRLARERIEQLTSQLQDKERIIQLLEMQLKK
ncbi:hypothetical protein F1C16_03000 [Hymenobacter sp. NBH84]|uniref:hypothetical protein n=1 Tax=Hymenobacter sp. NBH84 TaxID=2596915 RepID=UPI00162AA390|nr:hypothetical protein [Hymenobacter sp. NBH84]QNE38591.1 hypothetical protein F1C16_03000 [Hymenobacter sp. NBH84]